MQKVVLCGAGYGESYRRVFGPAGAQVIGIVGRGGTRSRSLALAMQVPLSHDLKPLLPKADLVIVAVGGTNGDRLALESLHYGVPVLREHPVSIGFVVHAARVAEVSRIPWLVNPHFAFLPAPAALIKRCRDLAGIGPPDLVSAVTNARMAFSAIDLMLRIADACGISLNSATITRTQTAARSIWHWAEGVVNLEIGTNFSANDNERDVMAGHRFHVAFNGSHLLLRSAAGPMVEIGKAPIRRFSVVAPCRSRIDFLQERELANLMAIQAMLSNQPTQADLLREQEHVARTAQIWGSMLRIRR